MTLSKAIQTIRNAEETGKFPVVLKQVSKQLLQDLPQRYETYLTKDLVLYCKIVKQDLQYSRSPISCEIISKEEKQKRQTAINLPH